MLEGMGLTWRLEGVHDGVEKLEYYKIRQEWKIDGVERSGRFLE